MMVEVGVGAAVVQGVDTLVVIGFGGVLASSYI